MAHCDLLTIGQFGPRRERAAAAVFTGKAATTNALVETNTGEDDQDRVALPAADGEMARGITGEAEAGDTATEESDGR